MKRFTSTEMGALVLAGVFCVSGLICLLWPHETVVVHATDNGTGWPGSYIEFVSKMGSQMYGIIAMLVGAGIAALAIYRGKT